ncbi:MAG TPA: TetR family transcriptional regulator [Solirubrobacteraceae bacterium]|jgi:AcrR family transcriptional regulator
MPKPRDQRRPAPLNERPAPGPLLAGQQDARGARGHPDGRRARGHRSRAAVLARSVQMASRDGLEGLTIGALAADVGVHKSSVHALFGSKQELQLATLEAARTLLIEQVILPAQPSAAGMPRLLAIGEAWCEYLAGDVFAGGCFLCAASAEMDGRPGPVRDAVAAVMREWIAVLTANVAAAIAAGDLRAEVEPEALAFRLNALGMAANWQKQLLDDASGIEHARAGWRAELGRLAPDAARATVAPHRHAGNCAQAESEPADGRSTTSNQTQFPKRLSIPQLVACESTRNSP